VPHLLHEEQSQQHPQLRPAVDCFLSSYIGDHLQGFLCASSQVLYTATLLHENWVDEEIFNALAKIIYLRQFIAGSNSTRRLLVMPTYFLSHIKQAFRGVPHLSTLNINNLCKRIRSNIPGSPPLDGVVIFKLDGRHYTTYVYPMNSATLIHADSLHQSPAGQVQRLLNQFIWPCVSEQTSGFVTGHIAQQGQGGGSGSCGIAALNFAEVWGNGDTPGWAPSQLQRFRMSALRDIILLHYLSCTAEGAPEDWIDPCIDAFEDSCSSDFAFGYSDFNIFQPKVSHSCSCQMRSN
jgi:hypothetical protein